MVKRAQIEMTLVSLNTQKEKKPKPLAGFGFLS
jgi:hypothetical protein